MVDNVQKIDLLGFQQYLNKQFLDIFEKKQSGKFDSASTVPEMGLIENFSSLSFFFPLKSLISISGDNRFESIFLADPWVIGFNQIRGDIFTIVDFEKIVELILTGKSSKNRRQANAESNFAYLRDKNDTKTALLLSNLDLKNTDDFHKLYSCESVDGKTNWTKNDNCGIGFDEVRAKLKKEDGVLLEKIQAIVDGVQNFSPEDLDRNIFFSEAEEKMFWVLVSDVYFDGLSEKLVLIVDTVRLSRFIVGVNPF